MRTSHSIIAALAILAGPAVAQETADAIDNGDAAVLADEQYAAVEIELGSFEAQELIGKRVYVSEDGAELTAGLENGWDDIGEVGDLVFSDDGELTSVLIDVGGFLGIGEKVVATQLEELSFYTENGGDDNFFVVYAGDRATLENQSAYEEGEVMTDEVADTSMDADDDAVMDENVEGGTLVAEGDDALEEGTEADAMGDDTMVAEGEVEAQSDVAVDDTAMAEADATVESGDVLEGEDDTMVAEGEAAIEEDADMTDETVVAEGDAAVEEDADMTDETVVAEGDAAVEEDADMTDETVVAEGDAAVEEDADMTDETVVAEGDATMEEPADAGEDTMVAEDDATMEDADMADDTMVAEGDRDLWDAPSMEMEGYANVEAAALTAEDLQGAPVFGTEDDRIGKVADVVLSDDGMIEYALIDVGGFLGIGQDRVEVGFEELQILRDEAGDDLRIFVAATEDQLKARADEYTEME
ncbi:PRC-barrel domain-containing protein [Pseudoroseicyclus sp. CXY001]|uniref:PRC-barrel domain-containing protein n=1 Tax=Pseudoroseicyclus sp. CXY001 TaxID=3242492 RepID=UPI00358DC698